MRHVILSALAIMAEVDSFSVRRNKLDVLLCTVYTSTAHGQLLFFLLCSPGKKTKNEKKKKLRSAPRLTYTGCARTSFGINTTQSLPSYW